MYALFAYLNNNMHKLYIKNHNEIKDNKKQHGNLKKTIKYIFILAITSVVLFVIGELLGNTLDKLCRLFKISEYLIGILIGFITSLPELITFFESQRYHKDVNDEMLGVVEATNNLFTSNTLNLFVIQTIGILILSI